VTNTKRNICECMFAPTFSTVNEPFISHGVMDFVLSLHKRLLFVSMKIMGLVHESKHGHYSAVPNKVSIKVYYIVKYLSRIFF
jgi:hypothetical protein